VELWRNPFGRILVVFVYRVAEFFVVVDGPRGVLPELVMVRDPAVCHLGPGPARSISLVEGVSAVHHDGDLREIVGLLGVSGRIRPGPGR